MSGEGPGEKWSRAPCAVASTLWVPGPRRPPAPQAPPPPRVGRLLHSGSLRPWLLSFLLISCFLDLTMAELLSVSLLKKAGGWLVLPGDLEPILPQRSDTPGQWAQC